MINLDTYVFVRILSNALRADEAAILESQPRSISAIVLWEIERLHRSRILQYGLDDSAVVELLAGTRVWPISPAVCLAMRQLDFESDPADELIAATSIAHNVPLLTRDSEMLRSKVVPLALL
jgi:PIN domain nuclease of toxin-antitoxin system